jgi:(p)ppGpp synthase/HD superfamily hydrolase
MLQSKPCKTGFTMWTKNQKKRPQDRVKTNVTGFVRLLNYMCVAPNCQAGANSAWIHEGGAVKNYDTDKELERAVLFMTQKMAPAIGQHRKAVALHSIRVALSLYDDTRLEVTIAAVLHDLVEDADVSLEVIAQEFGQEVAQLVAANSYNKADKDKVARDLDMFRRCKALGKEALLIKAADILDNSDYYPLRELPEHFDDALKKMARFIEMSYYELADEKIWHRLKQRHEELSKARNDLFMVEKDNENNSD